MPPLLWKLVTLSDQQKRSETTLEDLCSLPSRKFTVEKVGKLKSEFSFTQFFCSRLIIVRIFTLNLINLLKQPIKCELIFFQLSLCVFSGCSSMISCPQFIFLGNWAPLETLGLRTPSSFVWPQLTYILLSRSSH